MIVKTTYWKIIEKKIAYAYISQFTKKALGLEKIEFEIIRMLWEWDKKQIIGIIQ